MSYEQELHQSLMSTIPILLYLNVESPQRTTLGVRRVEHEVLRQVSKAGLQRCPDVSIGEPGEASEALERVRIDFAALGKRCDRRGGRVGLPEEARERVA